MNRADDIAGGYSADRALVLVLTIEFEFALRDTLRWQTRLAALAAHVQRHDALSIQPRTSPSRRVRVNRVLPPLLVSSVLIHFHSPLLHPLHECADGCRARQLIVFHSLPSSVPRTASASRCCSRMARIACRPLSASYTVESISQLVVSIQPLQAFHQSLVHS